MNCGAINSRADEHARIPICLLLELERQVEIVIIVFRSKIAVLLIRTALANEVAAIVHIPKLRAVINPPGKILPIEKIFFYRL